jgi:ATP-dependent 26S proteasome regulatory subunit
VEGTVLRPWQFSFPLFLLVPKGSNYYVRILSTIDRELLKPNASVALHKHSNALVDVLPPEADSSIMMLTSG